MLIDCHIHTSRYSPCSWMDPHQALHQARKTGLQALVITEHQVQWSPKEILELQQSFPDIAIYSGLEVTLDEDVDLVLITPNQSLRLPYHISFQRLQAELKPVWEHSFIFLAHAFRWTDRLKPEVKKILPYIHGLEMNSLNILNKQYQELQGKFKPKRQQVYEHTCSQYGLKKVYNSDAHARQALGSIANHLDYPGPAARDEKTLARLLKSKSIQEYQNNTQLQSLLG